jgi:hypothetical protein
MKFVWFSRGGSCDGTPCSPYDPVLAPESTQHNLRINGCVKEDAN